MSETASIYALTCTCSETCKGRIRYVGQTSKSLEERLKSHKARANKLPVGDWVHRHGSKHVIAVELEPEVPRALADEREIFWIREKGTFIGDDLGGLNLTRGGQRERDEEERFIASTRRAPKEKLDLQTAQEIRRLHSETDTPVHEIARKYHISVSYMHAILKNKKLPDPNHTFVPRKRGNSGHFKSSKVDWEQVSEIRSSDRAVEEIAQTYGIAVNSARRILKNETWYDPEYTPRDMPRKKPFTAITFDIAQAMRAEYQLGETTYNDLALKYGTSRSAAADILTNRTFKEKN